LGQDKTNRPLDGVEVRTAPPEVRFTLPFAAGLRSGDPTAIAVVIRDGHLVIRAVDGMLSIRPTATNWIEIRVEDY